MLRPVTEKTEEKRMRLLVVEDDALLGQGIEAGLKQAGFTVDRAVDGHAAALALDAVDYELLVLFTSSPGFDVDVGAVELGRSPHLDPSPLPHISAAAMTRVPVFETTSQHSPTQRLQ